MRDHVITTKNGWPRKMRMEAEEYLRLAKLGRRIELTGALSGKELASAEASTMDPGFDHRDAEQMSQMSSCKVSTGFT